MSEENLEKEVELLEKEVERLHAINEIQNLVGKYTALHTPKTFKRTPELFALKQPDVSAEIAMWGVYVGAQQIKSLYEKLHDEPLEGTMFEHQFTTPMIEVAGDGQTAKGVWFSPGHETAYRDGELQAYWCYGKYGADFIKEDGEWKIWHWHFYDTFMCPYDKSWVDYEWDPNMKLTDLNPNFALYPADRPMTRGAGYHKTKVRELVPGWPDPYETWDGKSMA